VRNWTGLITASCLVIITGIASAAEMRLAVTTSFHNSGLSEVLLLEVKRDLDLDVRLLVVGTGQALKLGQQGDVDAVLVHSRAAEENFITQGFAEYRREIMYNDFVFLGPASDVIGGGSQITATDVLKAIRQSGKAFVSRGDESGTHRKELSLWEAAHLKPDTFSSAWYRASGSSMGATLNLASAMNAYTFSDRASWLNFGNKGGLKIIYSGDPLLFNQYAYLPISSVKHPHVKKTSALRFEKWLTSRKGQVLIAKYKVLGQQLFVPNAKN